MNRKTRVTTQAKGQYAEDIACRFLQNRGMRLLERNYLTRHGELDLIMQDDDTLVFVEVRYRSSERFGGAVASINHAKQRKLVATAQHYLQRRHRQDTPCRFDVIAISGSDELQWLSNVIELS